jgi:hypothetical protein
MILFFVGAALCGPPAFSATTHGCPCKLYKPMVIGVPKEIKIMVVLLK